MITEKLRDAVSAALAQSVQEGELGSLESAHGFLPVIERPRLPEHGDYACGIALRLASQAKMAPLKIAAALHLRLQKILEEIAVCEVAPPGFINFRLARPALADVLLVVHQRGESYGSSQIGGGKKVLLEYVSVNPTGDLHVGHGRGAVLGSCLANLLRFGGYAVSQEYYLNDCGRQMQIFGECAWAAYKTLHGISSAYPQDGYPEDSVKGYVRKVIAEHGDKFLSLAEQDGLLAVCDLTRALLIQQHKAVLDRIGVSFDCWYSETPLHTSGKVDAVIDRLRASGLVYESESALWLKSKEFGDERDRVLVKGDGQKTYLATDAAYHLDKFERGYELLINVWGADHHGQVASIKAVVVALGKDPQQLEVIINQIVNISQDGKAVRMSKRQGTVVYLDDLIDDVGRDAVRYFLAESNPGNPIVFDLELAKRTSKENPVFYIQYAHARCCSILRTLLESSLDALSGQTKDPPVSDDDWRHWQELYKTDARTFEAAFDDDAEIFGCQKELVNLLSLLPAEVEHAVLLRQPGRLARYAFDVACALQKFYEFSRVLTGDKETMRARAGLVLAARQVLANVGAVIGIRMPERM